MFPVFVDRGVFQFTGPDTYPHPYQASRSLLTGGKKFYRTESGAVDTTKGENTKGLPMQLMLPCGKAGGTTLVPEMQAVGAVNKQTERRVSLT